MIDAPGSLLDTDPHPTFRLYSAGNFGEVAPDRLSVMSWSLVGIPTERAFRTFTETYFRSAAWHHGSHHTFVGYFGGKPYHNLSALGRLASAMPGVEAQDLATLYFEDAEVPTASGGGAGPIETAGLVLRIVREFGRLRDELIASEARVASIEEEARTALASAVELRSGAALERATEVLRRVWNLHIANTTWLVPAHATQRAIGRRAVEGWDDDLAAWINRPRELVWSSLYEVARMDLDGGPGEFLRHAFYEIADDREPFASLAVRHAGVAESPGGAPGASGDGRGVDVAKPLWDIASGLGGSVLRGITQGISDAMEAREASKSLVMRTLHVFRRLVPRVADAYGVPEETWPFLTIEELRRGPSQRTLELAGRRREAFDAALETAMPPTLDLESADSVAAAVASQRPPARPASGRGVSPGTAVGIAVTSKSIESYGDADPKILVCESADADIEPLLSRVAGLVSARGSLLSHVAILVRERGLPGVVGHPLATELGGGERIAIDGATGTVTVLEEVGAE